MSDHIHAPAKPDTAANGSSQLSDLDIYLFRQGNHCRLYDKLGAHPITLEDGSLGYYFAVWAPNARAVSVVGDFNGWKNDANRLTARSDGSGLWEGVVPGLDKGNLYKYHIESATDNYTANRGDPYAFFWETPPATSPITWNLDYTWNDSAWMKKRKKHNALTGPISVYEVHLGSWRRKSASKDDFLNYREIAPLLADYVKELGFTHVEFLPVMEHPFYGSWGYQTTGYFAPTSRYGTPQDFMYLVDFLHQQEIGVILDWVPSHFPSDEHGLVYFDGTHLYEHSDPREGFHPDWKSYIYNYGRAEVRSFLFSSAMFWLDKYHADGLRVDAVASMLYRDYSRPAGQWIPNKYGGRENLEAIDFLKKLNVEVYKAFPDVQMIAEESTAWPMVSKPTYIGGLGFGMKWNMGWMHDTLYYMSKNPIHRKYHHNELTFSMIYAFSENYMLPLSHDEVVHGKQSLVNKMPGDDWQRLANLRLLYSYQFAHPGKKLLFMGGEFAQWSEWAHDSSLAFELSQHDRHKGIALLVHDCNRLYRSIKALHEFDFEATGFEWIDFKDWEHSVISFLRKGSDPHEVVLVVCNFTPVPRFNYRVGVPFAGYWKEILNSDAAVYGGSNLGNGGGAESADLACFGKKQSVQLTLPPLAAIMLLYQKKEPEADTIIETTTNSSDKKRQPQNDLTDAIR
ncbi:MAG: 1,4-alpha-glucan branching protein GlgB [Chitinispirillaceae bacterium]|nr:1,4-alpha-glucan branching protein GlgB [Chitinispirillaceae bacterium]